MCQKLHPVSGILANAGVILHRQTSQPVIVECRLIIVLISNSPMFFSATLIAQVTNPILGGGLGQSWDYFNTVLPRFINIGYLIAIAVFVFIFIVGSFQWITAGGDKGKLAEARGKITHAIVGLLVLLLIFLITQFVNFVLGINIGMLGTPPGGDDSGYTSPSPTPVEFCTDSDGGQYPYVAGRVNVAGGSYVDSCGVESGVYTVVEWYCSGTTPLYVSVICPDRCTSTPQWEGYCL
jgi:hypothetical protein